MPTPFQHDEEEGFAELLAVSGITLTYGQHSLDALLRRKEAKPAAFDLTPGDDVEVTITLRREDLGGDISPLGASFLDAEGTAYRISKLIRSPHSNLLRFECVTTFP